MLQKQTWQPPGNVLPKRLLTTKHLALRCTEMLTVNNKKKSEFRSEFFSDASVITHYSQSYIRH